MHLRVESYGVRRSLLKRKPNFGKRDSYDEFQVGLRIVDVESWIRQVQELVNSSVR